MIVSDVCRAAWSSYNFWDGSDNCTCCCNSHNCSSPTSQCNSHTCQSCGGELNKGCLVPLMWLIEDGNFLIKSICSLCLVLVSKYLSLQQQQVQQVRVQGGKTVVTTVRQNTTAASSPASTTTNTVPTATKTITVNKTIPTKDKEKSNKNQLFTYRFVDF